MELAFLNAVYASGGPYAWAYLDTSRDTEEPDRTLALRRRQVCEELVAQGADAATVDALAAVAGGDREIAGRHGQAIVASHGQVVLTEELPEPPAHDEAMFAALPDLMPLAVQRAPDIPYVAATVHGPPRPSTAPSDELEVVFQAGTWPSSAVAPSACHRMGGPADDWLGGACVVADSIAGLAHDTDAETIVLGGTAWARDMLADQLAARWRKRLVTSSGSGSGRPAPPGRALMEGELTSVFRGQLCGTDRVRLDLFQARRTSRHGAVEGVPHVMAALRRSQVGTLLLNVPLAFVRQLYAAAGAAPNDLPDAALGPYGALVFRGNPAPAAVIRAAVRTGAALVVVERDRLPLDDGLGALLRYAGPERTPFFARLLRR
ncbi:baeRF2 domain-containing protein [Streptomyces sp. S186]|uniref:baeRF2 domain-containing protein n=1 Tax=Streptomyces sp. S186 TaxID=3434395 RepID=UPI003F6641AA